MAGMREPSSSGRRFRKAIWDKGYQLMSQVEVEVASNDKTDLPTVLWVRKRLTPAQRLEPPLSLRRSVIPVETWIRELPVVAPVERCRPKGPSVLTSTPCAWTNFAALGVLRPPLKGDGRASGRSDAGEWGGLGLFGSLPHRARRLAVPPRSRHSLVPH